MHSCILYALSVRLTRVMLGQKSRGNIIDVLRNVHAKFGSTERSDTKLQPFAKLDGMNFSTHNISAQKHMHKLLMKLCKCTGAFHCEVFLEHLYISGMFLTSIKKFGTGRYTLFDITHQHEVFWKQKLATRRLGASVSCGMTLVPGLKSQNKSALNSAVSEISNFSALISAVSEWVKKTSADQRCFRAVQRWFSLNQRCSALDQNEVRNQQKCFV